MLCRSEIAVCKNSNALQSQCTRKNERHCTRPHKPGKCDRSHIITDNCTVSVQSHKTKQKKIVKHKDFREVLLYLCTSV